VAERMANVQGPSTAKRQEAKCRASCQPNPRDTAQEWQGGATLAGGEEQLPGSTPRLFHSLPVPAPGGPTAAHKPPTCLAVLAHMADGPTLCKLRSLHSQEELFI
jgi:hypothetical protein